MKRGDIIIATVLVVALAWFGISAWTGKDNNEHGSHAHIMVDGKHYETVALTDEEQDIEIRTARGYNKLRVSRGGIEMIESDCPDKLCIGFGHVHDVNDTIVCLPNRIFVEITGPDTGEGVDAFVS
ncbi:NusG domain II-containing protein [Paenibacillus yanchengensis]|uniref:NusG domain II-containing protein n=1 Tax=Paenibacillus yanchengensis TaxID=2035833 RepID=A0ABW4YP83_9BACL